jgi:Flp pilus assembly pilin Flp
MIQYFQSLLFEAREEAGQTMAEYAVVLAVITLIVVAALTALSGAISGELTQVTNLLEVNLPLVVTPGPDCHWQIGPGVVRRDIAGGRSLT